MSIEVLATLEVPAEQREQVLDVFRREATEVRAEPGCEQYALYTSGDQRIILIERWLDNDSINAHAAGAPYHRLIDGVAALTPNQLVIEFLTPVG